MSSQPQSTAAIIDIRTSLIARRNRCQPYDKALLIRIEDELYYRLLNI